MTSPDAPLPDEPFIGGMDDVCLCGPNAVCRAALSQPEPLDRRTDRDLPCVGCGEPTRSRTDDGTPKHVGCPTSPLEPLDRSHGTDEGYVIGGLDAAWKAAEAALRPDQRLVMWQDRDGPRFVQVLAPDKTVTDDDGEPVDDVMAPVISILADYPSKGLGKGVVVELLALAARLSTDEPASRSELSGD